MSVLHWPDGGSTLVALGEELYDGATVIAQRRPLDQRRLYRRIETAALDALAHLTTVQTLGGVTVRDSSGKDAVTERACEVLVVLRSLLGRMTPRDQSERREVEDLVLRCGQAIDALRWISYGDRGVAAA